MTATLLFGLHGEHLGKLDSGAGTVLLRDLLWSEASRIGMARQEVVISIRDNVSDGGIDAKVGSSVSTDSLLTQGESYFQLKTGTSFKPWQPSALRKELFGRSDREPSKEKLGSEVRRCLDVGGRYVLVTLGHDLLPAQHSAAIEGLRELLTSCGYATARVEVLGQGQLLGLLGQFPSLCLRLTGRGHARFQTHESWKANADMTPELRLAAAQQTFIEEVQESVRGSGIQHVRVIGEPGIGKSRLVLEALCADDLSAVVLYIPTPEDFQGSSFFSELLMPDSQFTVTLVIDDCDTRNRAEIWNALRGRPRIQLITIDHGPEESHDSSMKVLSCPPLPAAQVVDILAGYVGTRHDLSNWSTWCEGSPRVAHAVGGNLKENPQDVLKPPATVPLWERFVLGHQQRGGAEAEQHLLVLRHLALFQRFGFEAPVAEEGRFIAGLCQAADPNVTWATFQRIVVHQRQRRVLQGRHTLFLVPKALHVHLWLGFWEHYGRGFDFPTYCASLPTSLHKWFTRLFIYAHQNPVAQDVVRTVLDPHRGPFSSPDFLVSKTGTRFLSCLAEADPAGTLNLLEQTFGRWSLEQLRGWGEGRQDIVWALEKIAVWREYFAGAARMLAALALAENSNYSNNSTGTLVGLFSIYPGLGATQATASDRFPVLAELVRGEDANERELGLKACARWLSIRGGSRIVGAEYQGLRPTVEFWGPATYGEYFDCLRMVWRFLKEEMRGWNEDDQRRAASCLINAAGPLLGCDALSEEVIQTLLSLASDGTADKEELTHFVIHQRRFGEERWGAGVEEGLDHIDQILTGTSFADRLARHVLYTNWDEGISIRDGKVEHDAAPAKRVEALALELVEDRALLEEQVPLLVTTKGHRLFELGRDVAQAAHDDSLDRLVLDAVRQQAPTATSQFLGGYFAGVRARDEQRWEQLMLSVLGEPALRDFGGAMLWHSGWSPGILDTVTNLYQAGQLTASVFQGLGTESRRRGISSPAISHAATALLAAEDRQATAICADLLDAHYCHEDRVDELPEDVAYAFLTAASALRKNNQVMEGFHWHRVALEFRRRYPHRDKDLLAALLEALDTFFVIRAGNYFVDVLDQLTKDYPESAWALVVEALDGELEKRFAMNSWLSDHGFEGDEALGAIRYFEPGTVMAWVKESPDTRARLIAHALPMTLDEEDGGALTAAFIEAYGDDDNLAGAVRLGLRVGGWCGPESEYLSRKRERARQWLSGTTSHKVQAWLATYIAELGKRIEAARVEEEREH